MHSNSALNLHGTVCNTNKIYLLLKGTYSEDTTSKHNMRHWCLIWRNKKSWSTSQWQGFWVTGRARELSWDRGQRQHSCRAPRSEVRGSGTALKSEPGEGLPTHGHGLWMLSLLRISKGIRAGDVPAAQEVNPAAAERQGWKSEKAAVYTVKDERVLAKTDGKPGKCYRGQFSQELEESVFSVR